MLELPKKTVKTQYNLRVDPDLMDWLKEQSAKCELPVNFIINHAIKQLRKENEVKV